MKNSRCSLWERQPFTVSQTGRLLARCHLLLGLPCLFAGILAALPFYLLICRFAFRVPGSLVWKRVIWIALPVLLFGMGSLWLLRRRLATWPKTLSVYPLAAAYIRQQTVWLHSRRRMALPVGLLIAGGILTVFSIAAPSIRWATDLRLVLAMEFLTVGLGTFLLLHRALKKRFAAQLKILPVPDIQHADRYSRKRELKIRWGLCALYWLVVAASYLGLSIAFGNWLLYSFLPLIACLYFLLHVLLDHPFRPYASLRKWNVGAQLAHLAVLGVLAVVCWSLIETGYSFHRAFLDSLDYDVFRSQPSCDVTYDRKTGVYTLTARADSFRILQLTDIHIGESLTTIQTDRRALQTCYDLIAQTKPDLIIVTGDIAYAIPTMTFSNNNLCAMSTFSNFMNRVGIPWIFTYGNHDNEPSSQYRDEKPFEGLFLHDQSTKQSCMLYAHTQPDIYGRYNQYLRLCNSDGSLNRLLFLMDSNDYVKGVYGVTEYDSIHEDQIRWYADAIDQVQAEEGRVVPSFVFMHIPFHAFAEAQNAVEAHSPDAIYLYGKNEEAVSHPAKDSGFFDVMVEKGSTQAVFVGHDHVNHMAIRYRGVDLVYSKSIDYVAYPGIAAKTEQRGATLITVNANGTYELAPISYQGAA